MTALEIINLASKRLQDIGAVRWTVAGLLEDLHEGRLDMCSLRPELYAERETLTLVAGVEQAIPADGSRYLGPICNVSAAGVQGRSVRSIEMEELDAIDPNWRSTRQATKVVHTLFDEQTPRMFDVYPPVVVGTKLRVSYAAIPAATLTSTELTQEGEFAPALVDYLLYASLVQDQDIPQSAQMAQAHYGMYLQKLGATKRSGLLASPNFREKGAMPPKELTNG